MKLKKTLSISLALIALAAVLLLPATSKQGINGKIRTIHMPLYVKLMEFFSRDYNYKMIVREVTSGADTQEEKVMKLFSWTCSSLRKVPDGFPVVDDHVLNIIIRGYGTDDQFADVFATLCNYVGVNAFYSWVRAGEVGLPKISLVFVNISGKWHVFDPYNHAYFINKSGALCELHDFSGTDARIVRISSQDEPGPEYSAYFKNIPLALNDGFSRSTIQSPVRRLEFAIKTLFRRK